MTDDTNDPSRRSVLKGSAIGAGALIGMAGLGASRATAATSPASVDPALVTGPSTFFLKLDGISGESSLGGAGGYIELSSFSFGVTRAASEGRSTGKQAAPGVVHFTAPISKASPNLMLEVISGKPIKTASITATQSDGGQKFLKIDLTDVIISSYEVGAAGPDPSELTDSGSLNFAKIEYSYYPQNPAGGFANPINVIWNTRTLKYE